MQATIIWTIPDCIEYMVLDSSIYSSYPCMLRSWRIPIYALAQPKGILVYNEDQQNFLQLCIQTHTHTQQLRQQPIHTTTNKHHRIYSGTCQHHNPSKHQRIIKEAKTVVHLSLVMKEEKMWEHQTLLQQKVSWYHVYDYIHICEVN